MTTKKTLNKIWLNYEQLGGVLDPPSFVSYHWIENWRVARFASKEINEMTEWKFVM